MKIGDLENALADASMAVKLNPLFPLGYYCKGKALHELKQFSEATAAFQDGLLILPEDALLLEGWDCLRKDDEFVTHQKESLYQQGNASVDSGNFAEAVEHLSKAISLNNQDCKFFLSRSVAYMRLGDYKNSSLDADSSIKLNPRSPKGYYLKGKALHEIEQFEDAISAFEEGLSNCPVNTELIEGLRRVREDERYLKTSRKKPDAKEVTLENEVDARSTHDEELPRTDISTGQNDASTKGSFEIGTVDEWLLSRLPGLKADDVSFYSKRLIQDGFDSVNTLGIVEEEDLDFMKKGHRRLLMKAMKSKK